VLVRKIVTDPSSLTARALGLPEYSLTEFLLADLRAIWTEDKVKNPWRVRTEVAHRNSRAQFARARRREFEARKRRQQSRG
jgi:hypothetical protein